MSSTRIKIIRKHIGHFAFKIVSIFVVVIIGANIFSVPLLSSTMLIYVSLIILSLAVWTAKEVVVIDLGSNVIREGISILWISSLDTYSFSGLEKIFFNKIKIKSELRRLASTTTIHDEQFKAFIKTNEGEKVCIAIDKDKDRLITKLKRLNEKLKVPIFDNTGSEPIQIDLS